VPCHCRNLPRQEPLTFLPKRPEVRVPIDCAKRDPADIVIVFSGQGPKVIAAMPLERCPECDALRAHLSKCSLNSRRSTSAHSFQMDASDRKWGSALSFAGVALFATRESAHRDSWSHGDSLLWAAILAGMLVITLKQFSRKAAD
jgi:hypothetical protein